MLPLLQKKSSSPLFEQLYEFFKNEIRTGRLKTSDRLPSVRNLSRDLDVSKNTVIKAYEQLQLEGYFKNYARKGFFVNKLDKLYLHEDALESFETKSGKKFKYNLSQSCTDQKNFPIRAWRKVSQQALDHFHGQLHGYEERAGLKEELAKYLYVSRGVRSSPDQIIICAGTGTLLLMLAFLFRQTHNQIIFEEPGYEEGREIFKKTGFKILPIQVTPSGIDLNSFPSSRKNLVYVTPSHQFPIGGVMPVQERMTLINWAAKTQSYIIEDDYDSELRYKGRPLPSLQALDQNNRVIYTGTFSKVLMPSLRVAYMVIPKNAFPKNSLTEYLGWEVSFLTQKTLALFFKQKFWDRHLRKMRMIYRKKYEFLTQQIPVTFGKKISFTKTYTGLYVVLTIKTTQSATQLIEKANAHGIYLLNTDSCYYRKRKTKYPSVFLGFGGLETEEIKSVLTVLKTIWGL
jgi:GntR family transcriptional regulator/MocR family aminotransferase